jgi:hypothetical protein
MHGPDPVAPCYATWTEGQGGAWPIVEYPMVTITS